VLGGAVYMAGGQTAVDSVEALRSFWKLPLTKLDSPWEVLDPWPGSGRMLPVIAAQAGAFYVISGAELFAQPSGNPGRIFLKDGYAWTPAGGWKRIADGPAPMLAAGAGTLGQSHIVVISGDDGDLFTQSAQLGDDH